MAEKDDEWTIVKPGEEPPPVIASGPSASEWTIIPPAASREARSPALTGSDVANLGYMGANAFTFGLGNRASAVGAALGKGTSYAEELARINAADEETRKKHPWLSVGAEVGGGIGNAAALIRTGLLRGAPAGANWMRQAGQGLAEGGVLGALQGAGTTYSGIPSDYLHNAGMGGILGAGMGAVAPAIGTAAGAAYRAVADRGFRGGVPAHLAQAAQADQAGLRALPNTPGAMLPDAGPSMLGMAQGSVTEGPGSSALINNLTARNTASPQRITADVNRTFGPATVPSQVEAQVGENMRAMGNAYDQVFQNARAIDNRPLALWLEGQIGNERGAAQTALTNVRRMLDVPTNPGVLDPHPRAMQATREAVRGMRDDPNIDPNVRRVLGETYDRLTQEMHAKIPGVRQLDSQYAELGAQQRAVAPDSPGSRAFIKDRAGVTRPVELQETLTEAAQPKGVNVGPSAEAFRLTQAGRSELERIVGTNKNDLLALENVLGQPQDWNAAKLGVMFGQDRADALMEVLRRERMFRDTHQKVVEGSQTARRTQAAKAQEGDEGKIPWDITLTGIPTRGLQELWRAGQRNSINAGRDRIAGLMAEQDPVRLQQLVDQMLAAQPTRDVRQELAKRLAQRGLIGGAGATAPSITNR